MAILVSLSGMVLGVSDRRKKAIGGVPGEVWGRSVQVLSEVGDSLGSPVYVTVYPDDYAAAECAQRDNVNWCVRPRWTAEYGLDWIFSAALDKAAVKA